MNINKAYGEADLPLLAKAARLKSGDTKTQAAKKLRVAVSSVFDAEENPRAPRRTVIGTVKALMTEG